MYKLRKKNAVTQYYLYKPAVAGDDSAVLPVQQYNPGVPSKKTGIVMKQYLFEKLNCHLLLHFYKF